MGCIALLAAVCAHASAADEPAPAAPVRQALDEAWWTGPLLAASAGSLPRGHMLVEPYLFDSVVHERFDARGDRHATGHVNAYGSLTYVLYGVTDRITAGVIPRFGYTAPSGGPGSSGIGVGDFTVQAQYRLTQFREGRWLPTMSVVLGQSFPTGKYDRLGDNPSNGFGSGAYTTTASLYMQSYFWMPTGRILRTRLDLSYGFSSHADVSGVSVYGTGPDFTGRAQPGDSFVMNAAWEYSATQSWVLALDAIYEHGDGARVSGRDTQGAGVVQVAQRFDSSQSFSLAPAIEYNWSGAIGVIAGAKVAVAGRNTGAAVIPVIAVNYVH